MDPDLLHYIAGASISACVGAYAATRRERDEARPLVIAFSVAMFLWSAGMGVRKAAAGDPLADFALPVYLAGGMAIAPLWVVVAIALTRAEGFAGTRPRVLWAILGLPTALFYLAAVTNDWHHLYYVGRDPLIRQSLLEIAGPLLWPAALWLWLLVVAGIVLYVRKAAQLFSRGYHLRAAAIAGITIAPLPVSLANSFGIFGDHTGITQSTAAVTVALLFALSWRYRLRETLPLARRDVIEHLSDGVIILNGTGDIIDLNPAARRLCGAGFAEPRGRSILDLFHELNREEKDVAFRRAIAVFESSHGPWFHTFRDRRGRVLEVTTATLGKQPEAPMGYFVVVRDQTERRRLERLLSQSQRLETVSGLAAGLAHEVNNPLAYIRANLGHIARVTLELEKQLADVDESSEVLGEVGEVARESIDGIDRIASIIERMRRFSRIQGDTRESVDLNQVVRDALKLADLHRPDSVVVEVDLDPRIPKIEGSPEHLVQALLNVLVHAKESVSDTTDARVRIETRALDGLIEVVVEDNGQSGDLDDSARIFDPFLAEGDSSNASGLGLAIAFGILREHYGVLELEEGPQGGTRLRVRIPARTDGDV